jgi:hypothetical protein
MAAIRRPRYAKEEFAKRGEAVFKKEIQPHVKGLNPRDFVVIDIETGDYKVDADEDAASERLTARLPDAQIWMRRVGTRISRRFGGRTVDVGRSHDYRRCDGKP